MANHNSLNPFSDEALDARQRGVEQALNPFSDEALDARQQQFVEPDPISVNLATPQQDSRDTQTIGREQAQADIIANRRAQQIAAQRQQQVIAAAQQPRSTVPRQPLASKPDQETGLLATIGEAFTGAKRTTPEIEEMPEIGPRAPELRQLDKETAQGLAGLLVTSDPGQIENIMRSVFPDAGFRADSKGNKIIDLPSGSYALNKPGLSGGDIARGIFEALAFFPATAIPARAGSAVIRVAGAGIANAATDLGLQKAAQELGAGNNIEFDRAAVAGVFGSGGQIVQNLLSGGSRLAGGLSKETAELLVDAEQQGIPIFTSDVVEGGFTQGLARTAEELPIIGTSGARVGQALSRKEAVKAFMKNVENPTFEQIVGSVQSNAKAVTRRAGNTIREIERVMDGFGNVNLVDVNQQISRSIASLRNTVGVIDERAITRLEKARELFALNNNRTGYSFSEVRKIRSDLRKLFNEIDPATLQPLSTVGRAAAKDVEVKIRTTLENFVGINEAVAGLRRSKLAKRFKKANQIFKKAGDKLSKSSVKEVIKRGLVEPEIIERMIFSSKPSDVTHLMSSLDVTGKANVRSAMLQGILKRSMVEGKISPNAFARQVDNLDENVAIAFGRGTGLQQQKLLRGLTAVLQTTSKAEKQLGASDQAIAQASPGNIATIIGMAIRSVGVASISEGKKVRGLLLRLADNPANKTLVNKIVNLSTLIARSGAQNPLRETVEADLPSVR